MMTLDKVVVQKKRKNCLLFGFKNKMTLALQGSVNAIPVQRAHHPPTRSMAFHANLKEMIWICSKI